MTKPSSTPVCPAALFAFGWNWSSASGSSPGAVLEFRIVEIVSSLMWAERLPAKWPEIASTSPDAAKPLFSSIASP